MKFFYLKVWYIFLIFIALFNDGNLILCKRMDLCILVHTDYKCVELLIFKQLNNFIALIERDSLVYNDSHDNVVKFQPVLPSRFLVFKATFIQGHWFDVCKSITPSQRMSWLNCVQTLLQFLPLQIFDQCSNCSRYFGIFIMLLTFHNKTFMF